MHDWNPNFTRPFVKMTLKRNEFFIQSIEERKNFIRFLAQGLKWRTLNSVYKRFKYIYNKAEKYGYAFIMLRRDNLLLVN